MREDGITLYGFPDPADRTWFRLLQTVQGVGARVALSLLGTLRPDELANAIAAGDKAMLARANGVGAKLAARIVAELKDRVGALPQRAAGVAASGAIGRRPRLAAAGAAGDALSALLHLGYGRGDAFAAARPRPARLGAEAAVDALVREGAEGAGRVSDERSAWSARPSGRGRRRQRCGRGGSPSSSARRSSGPTSPSSSRRRARAATRSTTSCSPGRRASARRRWRRSWRPSSASASA